MLASYHDAKDFFKRAATLALAGTLALSSLPATAIAAEGDAASSEGQPSEPPSGGMGPGSSGEGTGGASGQMEEPPDGTGGGSLGEPPDGTGGGQGGGDGQGGMGGGTGGADTMSFDYTGSYTGALTANGEAVTSNDESYSATEADQNAALAQNGGTLTITDGTLTKSGDDTNGDNCNFYGLNSILLAVGESSSATVSDTELSATSEGSNAIFATDGATVFANDVEITTTAGNSRGLDATYGGTIVANDVEASTQGDHCATVATDRGGGSISVTDSELATAGLGSPILYSTGDIEVSDITGTATGSQLCGMEGLNTILINNSVLTSTVTGATSNDPVANGVIIYQSTSGDAESTTGSVATFQAADSTLSSAIESGSMFYLTNTSADVVLCRTKLDFDSSAANLLLAAGNDANSWGQAGSNGAAVTLTAIEQELVGTIEADTISSANVYLTNGSTWTGKAVISENAAGSTSEAPLTVNVDATSSWVVTEDCTLSALTVAEGGSVVDASGKTVSVVAGTETVVEGESSITVTVTGSYSTSYDASAAGTLSTSLIDRTAFDAAFSCETTWAMGDAAVQQVSAETTSEASDVDGTEAVEPEGEDEGESLFQMFVNWLTSLFGL